MLVIQWAENTSVPKVSFSLALKILDLSNHIEYQLQYPPNSQPTDITLSQFLSIQEKGVSAWCFEPDYESTASLLVHARTEITFLPDPASASCVQSNLPLPKLNEVYYWEVKLFDLPSTTNVSIGLATKPYPPFRLPGHARHSIAYHSSGDRSFNWPFTSAPFASALREGDVLGVGYRPRSGTVFFTRNGRKTEDAFVGLGRWNLFPTIGADGPCSVHANLGQAGFVFIEANVKKWGLAPSVGTLAPPPAYGRERGSILLDVGGTGRTPPQGTIWTPAPNARRTHRSRRSVITLNASSPLSAAPINAQTEPPPAITSEDHTLETGSSTRYVSPSDRVFHTAPALASNHPQTPPHLYDALEYDDPTQDGLEGYTSEDEDEDEFSLGIASPEPEAGASIFSTPRHARTTSAHSRTLVPFIDPGPSRSAQDENDGAELTEHQRLPPQAQSPVETNPPTPHPRDIHLRSLSSQANSARRARSTSRSIGNQGASSSGRAVRGDVSPPAYSPLNAFTYSDGVHIDLPAEVIAAALEGNGVPPDSVGRISSPGRDDRRRSRRHR